jgi:rhodanese-related sulfurtransferase
MKKKYVLIPLVVALMLFTAQYVFPGSDEAPRITVQELKSKMDKGEEIVIIDVRTGLEYDRSKSKIKGSIRIPILQLAERSKELPKDKEIVTYCT